MDSLIIDAWLMAKLRTDSVLTPLIKGQVFSDVAPNTAKLPYIVFQMQVPEDIMSQDGTRIMSEARYLIRALAQTQTFGAPLKDIADRIDVLLHKSSGIVTGNPAGTIYGCVREREYRITEVEDDNTQIRHLGAYYHITVQDARNARQE